MLIGTLLRRTNVVGCELSPETRCSTTVRCDTLSLRVLQQSDKASSLPSLGLTIVPGSIVTCN